MSALTHPLKMCARAMTALLGLGLLATASALPFGVGVPALPATGQDIQTPVGGIAAGLQDNAAQACASTALPALPVPALPMPVPVAVPDGACLHADLNDQSIGVDAGAASLQANADHADIDAGPVQTNTQSPLGAMIDWLSHLF